MSRSVAIRVWIPSCLLLLTLSRQALALEIDEKTGLAIVDSAEPEYRRKNQMFVHLMQINLRQEANTLEDDVTTFEKEFNEAKAKAGSGFASDPRRLRLFLSQFEPINIDKKKASKVFPFFRTEEFREKMLAKYAKGFRTESIRELTLWLISSYEEGANLISVKSPAVREYFQLMIQESDRHAVDPRGKFLAMDADQIAQRVRDLTHKEKEMIQATILPIGLERNEAAQAKRLEQKKKSIAEKFEEFREKMDKIDQAGLSELENFNSASAKSEIDSPMRQNAKRSENLRDFAKKLGLYQNPEISAQIDAIIERNEKILNIAAAGNSEVRNYFAQLKKIHPDAAKQANASLFSVPLESLRNLQQGTIREQLNALDEFEKIHVLGMNPCQLPFSRLVKAVGELTPQ